MCRYPEGTLTLLRTRKRRICTTTKPFTCRKVTSSWPRARGEGLWAERETLAEVAYCGTANAIEKRIAAKSKGKAPR